MKHRTSVIRLTKSPSEQDLRSMTKLAWRPAWSLRNRQGSLILMLAWWRRWRALRDGRT